MRINQPKDEFSYTLYSTEYWIVCDALDDDLLCDFFHALVERINSDSADDSANVTHHCENRLADFFERVVLSRKQIEAINGFFEF